MTSGIGVATSPRVTLSTRTLTNTRRCVFRVEDLRPGQEEVVRSVLSGRDTLALMPTGARESLCYELPVLDLKGTTVVVSPMVSVI